MPYGKEESRQSADGSNRDGIEREVLAPRVTSILEPGTDDAQVWEAQIAGDLLQEADFLLA
jgi:hypothetical protein